MVQLEAHNNLEITDQCVLFDSVWTSTLENLHVLSFEIKPKCLLVLILLAHHHHKPLIASY